MMKVLKILLGATIFVVVLGFVWWYFVPTTPHCGLYESRKVSLGEKTLSVVVADNDCKRILGLSGQTLLKPDTGMLFVYDTDGAHGIWMKNMNFSIDILWLNSSGAIIGIEQNITPGTYPMIFGEKFNSKYILELPAGYVAQNKLRMGDLMIKQ